MKEAGMKTKSPIRELCTAKYKRGISADENNVQLRTRMNARARESGKLLLRK
jgi:hypothetical protein